MATNRYINQFSAKNEQSLAASLIEEAIQFYGHDFYYVPRTNLNYDSTYKESTNVSYDTAFPIEMYIKSIDGYGGQNQFLSNFGVEVRNQVMLAVSIQRWETVAADATTPVLERPKEGDIIYFDLDNKLLEIKKVDRYSMFYQLGTLYTYDLTCEVFEFSGEEFNTGVPEIDVISQQLSIDTEQHGSIENGVPNFDDNYDFVSKFADNKTLEEESEEWIDFKEDNPFSAKF